MIGLGMCWTWSISSEPVVTDLLEKKNIMYMYHITVLNTFFSVRFAIAFITQCFQYLNPYLVEAVSVIIKCMFLIY